MPPFQLRRTHAAANDLLAIWDYIADDNPAAADRLIRRLDRLFSRTERHPWLGRPAGQLGAGHRVLILDRYLLIYCVYEDVHVSELVRVVHGARDWMRLFDRNEPDPV